jgi:hypothetical protein
MAWLGFRSSLFLAPVLLMASAGSAHAGLPECNYLRLEDVGSCEIRGDVECTGGCDDFGIYKKACATKLMRQCREECVLDPEPTCEDECTVQCNNECDIGVSITCQHNCFGECVGSCELTCQNSAEPEQCLASCEATCDGECDVQCGAAVDGDCYYHCIECCDGSCGAQANMTCQTTCQDREFETCEYEFRADCDASCSGDGALFCDNEYVLAGSQIPACVTALAAQGTAAVDLRVSGKVDTNVDLDFGSDSGGGGCSVAGAPEHTYSALFLIAAGAVAGSWLRRRQRNRG